MFTSSMMMIKAARTYATINPADKDPQMSLNSTHLIASGVDGFWAAARATQAFANKQYYEMTMSNVSSTKSGGIGLLDIGASILNYLGSSALCGGINSEDTQPVSAGTITKTATTWISNSISVWGFAMDEPNKKAWVQKAAAVWLDGNPVTGTSPTFSAWSGTTYPAASIAGGGFTITYNFGASPFTYPVPSGFNAGVYI
jgi:hypothetical protein